MKFTNKLNQTKRLDELLVLPTDLNADQIAEATGITQEIFGVSLESLVNILDFVLLYHFNELTNIIVYNFKSGDFIMDLMFRENEQMLCEGLKFREKSYKLRSFINCPKPPHLRNFNFSNFWTIPWNWDMLIIRHF